jgi:hypothetical protein
MLFSVISCKKQPGGRMEYQKSQPAPSLTREEVEAAEATSSIEKVKLAQRIEPSLDVSIAEKWSAKKWREMFGEPAVARELKDGTLLLGYYEDGPYHTGSKKIITGVDIWIINGVTEKWDWHFTTLGDAK